MWISYSDSEVNEFHPICQNALVRALQLSGQDNEYRVIHHQYTGRLEMDFVIQNINTGKYLCVIEVKRTPADVHSARYQYQTMSYVQMNAEESEKPFYILTNLEYAFAFRYDFNRTRVFQQMLKPGLSSIGSFEDDKTGFETKLTEYFRERIEEFISNDYEYLVTLEEFALHMERIKGNSKQWKSHLAILLYEYIRGAFTFLNRNELRDVRLFQNDIIRICNEAARINFKDIFNYSDELFENRVNISNTFLSNLFDLGNQNVTGDSIAGILHQIVSSGQEHNGEVPTDLELGRLVATLSKHINGDLNREDLICDPAVGSGNLISSSIDVLNLLPNQILVNDINPKLLELLSLRLGLNYARSVSNENSPKLYNENIVNLEQSFFNNVKIIVMNPPFVAGINCVDRKKEFYRKMGEISSGYDIKTNRGQMPLEAVFLELITLMVEPGTTIACVFPKTHLTARGTEAQIIRHLILENLGLEAIFTYPGEEIFNNVTKGTCILVGRTRIPSELVKVISSYDKIPDIDLQRFTQTVENGFSTEFQSIMPGIVAKKINTEELLEEIENGWRVLNTELVEAIEFVKAYFEDSNQFERLSDSNFSLKRGRAGNSGGSDLVFFDSREELYGQFQNQNVNLGYGMRNAKLETFIINGGDSRVLDVVQNEVSIVEEIVETYIALPEREGRQKRKKKNKSNWLTILNRESRGIFEEHSILIPRGIRTVGRVYLSNEPVFVSTNFVVCTLTNYEKSLLLSTWMSTVFYQLICEVSSKDQEGMRKMEIGDIDYTFIPLMDNISDETIDLLESEKNNIIFLNLKSPEIRNIDIIWANELFGDAANDVLSQAVRLLEFLSNRRNS